MKVGVNLINFGPGATPDSLARWGQLAEALGYHLLMVSDHVAITPDVQALYPAPFYDPFVTLAWARAQHDRADHQGQLIDQTVSQQFVPERAAAEDQDVLSGLAFEFGDSSARSRT